MLIAGIGKRFVIESQVVDVGDGGYSVLARKYGDAGFEVDSEKFNRLIFGCTAIIHHKTAGDVAQHFSRGVPVEDVFFNIKDLSLQQAC